MNPVLPPIDPIDAMEIALPGITSALAHAGLMEITPSWTDMRGNAWCINYDFTASYRSMFNTTATVRDGTVRAVVSTKLTGDRLIETVGSALIMQLMSEINPSQLKVEILVGDYAGSVGIIDYHGAVQVRTKYDYEYVVISKTTTPRLPNNNFCGVFKLTGANTGIVYHPSNPIIPTFNNGDPLVEGNIVKFQRFNGLKLTGLGIYISYCQRKKLANIDVVLEGHDTTEVATYTTLLRTITKPELSNPEEFKRDYVLAKMRSNN